MNILITTASWKSALTCMRSLGNRGHKISLISSSKYTPSLYSKYCSERIISPDEIDKQAYMSFIIKLVKTNKYEFLIPISDLCVEYFSEKRADLSKYVRMILPSQEAIDIASNKDKTYRFAQEIGVPIPNTYFPSSLTEVEDLSKTLSFPCVIKKTKGTAGNGNTYVYSRQDMLAYFKNMNNGTNSWPVIQEFIDGQFCDLVAVCNKGEIIDCFMFEVLRQHPDTGGALVYARSFFDNESYEYSVKLIKKLGWTGPIDLDFFIVKNKGFLLLEINPRFSGVTQFAYSLGVDLPYRYLELILDRNFDTQPTNYKEKILYRTIFPEEINSCIKNRKHIPAFILNFLRPKVHYDFSFSDPNLLFWQLRAAKWDIFS